MLFQNKSFEVCSNRTLSEKYCEKRAEAVKRVLMCAEASMSLHYHTKNLTPLHSDFPEYLHNYGITAFFTQHLERGLFQ